MNATPQQITAVALLVQNAADQLHALASDPSHIETAHNACKLARDSLDLLLEMTTTTPPGCPGRAIFDAR